MAMHLMKIHMGLHGTLKTNASAVNFCTIFSCEILDFGQQLSVCVDGIIESKATE